MALITDPDQIADVTEYNIDTALREFTLNIAGNLSNDGVTLQALYSSFKDDWKDDPQTKTLIAYPFPMVAITPEQFEMVFDWEPNNNTTRKLIRTGGWREIDTENATQLKAEYAGVITLGSFEDAANDTAYYQAGADPTDTASAINFNFAGPVNEAILVYNENVVAGEGTGVNFTASTIERTAGDWIADGYRIGAQVTVLNAELSANNGTFVITDVTATILTVSGTPFTADTLDVAATFATNYRNAITVFLRERDADPNGKIYSQATLSDIGVSEVDNKVFRFPLSNATDLKITETDANIATISPYTEINLKYFPTAYSREVDTPGTLRNFGIVIDVGTHSGIDGSFNTGGSVLTTTEGGIETDARYVGGTLTIHEGTDATNVFTIDSVTATTVTVSGGTFQATESAISFTLQRASPVVATAEEIYEKVQYQLRQAADINDVTGIVTGLTADELLAFVGDNLNAGSALPNNPEGGGSGVAIEGFDSNDTNRIALTDNTEASRSFPFVAAGNINFNDNLVSDSGPAEYTMFFQYTSRTAVADLELTAPTTNTATLNSAGAGLPTITVNDYINLQGFADPNNNGIWQVTAETTANTTWEVTKTNSDNVSAEGPLAGTVDKNPINSPDAIIVQNNAAANIAGIIGGSSVSFDFDYDGNVQGGRTQSTNAAIIIRAIGTDTAQFVETTGTITRNTGLVLSLVAALERNYLAGTV